MAADGGPATRDHPPELHAAGASTWLLRYRTRGWDGGAARIEDARGALDEVRATVGEVPIVLLGHSMGGRTAVHVADDPQVLGVVAGALPAGEPVDALRGKQLRAAHGRRDRITSYLATRAFVDRAKAAGADATLTDMGWAGHYLLTRITAGNAFAAGQAGALVPGPETSVQYPLWRDCTR